MRDPWRYLYPKGKAIAHIAISTTKPKYLSMKIDARARLPFPVSRYRYIPFTASPPIMPGRKILKKDPIMYREKSFPRPSPSGKSSLHLNVDTNWANTLRRIAEIKAITLRPPRVAKTLLSPVCVRTIYRRTELTAIFKKTKAIFFTLVILLLSFCAVYVVKKPYQRHLIALKTRPPASVPNLPG